MAATKAVTVRLERDDYERLEDRSERLGVKPGTFARMLVRAGLRDEDALGAAERRAGLEALDWFDALRTQLPPGEVDAVQVVREGREALDRRHAS